MNGKTHYLFIGLGFFLLGAVMLLEEFRIIHIDESYTFASLCLLACLALFNRYRQNENIWMLILSAGFLFISSAIIIDSFYFVDDAFIGILLFIMLTALFTYLFTMNRHQGAWLIPAGVSLTIATMVFMDEVLRIDGEFVGCMFFLGIGLTFAFMYLMHDESNRLAWAKIPAIGFIAFAVFIFFASVDLVDSDLYFPLLMIVAGGWLIFRSRKSNRRLITAK